MGAADGCGAPAIERTAGAAPSAAGYGGTVDPLTGARRLRSAPEITFTGLDEWLENHLAGYGRAVDPLTGARRLRSAPEIFFTGLKNLLKDPLGWLFGPPSPLYSDLPRDAPRPTYPPAGQRRWP